MEIAYCRREIGEKFCCKPLSLTGKNNPLNWCPECRERLPLWPADEPTPCRHCGFVGRDHYHTLPPEPIVHVGRAIADLFGGAQ